jgi:hypothetical protein
MWRSLGAALLLATVVCGCDVVSSVKEGMTWSNETAAAIEKQVGVRPQVGFNYQNGQLVTVTIQFGSVPSVDVPELEKIARAAVLETFKKEPTYLIVSFSFPKHS